MLLMGKASRSKGQRGEREVAKLLEAAGFEASRHRIGAANDDILHDIPGVSIEVKRSEKLMLPAWIRQADEQAGDDREPVLFFRQSRQPWRVVITAEYYLNLIGGSDELGE